MSGYAGTGKTTIVDLIIGKLGLAEQSVTIACPTNNAADVLTRKLIKNGSGIIADTIHSLIYTPKITKVYETPVERKARLDRNAKLPPDEQIPEPRPKQKISFKMKDYMKTGGIKLIIIDEASMLDGKMYEDLKSLGIKILFIGDIGQLPPVTKGKKNVFILGKPDVLLSQVVRQAEDNPIIQMSIAMREKNYPKPGFYGKNNEIRVIKQSDFNKDREFMAAALTQADQIICGKNATRHMLNDSVRYLRGFKDQRPQPGDKLICLKNSKDVAVDGYRLVNGMLVTVTDEYASDESAQLLEILPQGATNPGPVDASSMPFYDRDNFTSYLYDIKEEVFDYGYAITCHKAQGAEWDNVLVIAENFDNDTFHQWLYTAVTRAGQRLILVMPDYLYR